MLVTCHHCGHRVLPTTQDGCPSCGQIIEPESLFPPQSGRDFSRKIVVGPSRCRPIISLLVSLAFVAGGIFLLIGSGHTRGGRASELLAVWSAIIFFGSCAFGAASHLIDLRPRLIVDDEGIFDRVLGVGRIPWSDIQGAYLRQVRKHCFLSLEIVDSERYLQRLPYFKRALARANPTCGLTPVSLNLSAIALDPKGIFEIIVERIREQTENA